MEIIVSMPFGSNLYGTNTPNSDQDYHGIFLPPIKDIILNNVQKSYNNNTKTDSNIKNTKNDIDDTYFSIYHFLFKLACFSKIDALDMLHCPKDKLIIYNEIWNEIIDKKNLFYSKLMSKSVREYCGKQANKYSLRSSRLHTVETILAFIDKYESNCKLKDVWDDLPCIEKHAEKIYSIKDNINYYNICGKLIQETIKLHYIKPILLNFIDKFGERSKLAKENKGIDHKAISHAFRAALQIKEIYETGNLIFPLKDAKFLINIKNGNYDFNESIIHLESLIDEIEKLTLISNYPDTVDIEYWKDWLYQIIIKRIK